MSDVKELKYGNTRCYLLNSTLLIDTDMAGTLQSFFSCIKKSEAAFDKIQCLICTHYHPDHMGIAQDLVELGIKLVVFEEQKRFIHFSDAVFARDRHIQFKPIKDQDTICISCADSRNFLKKLGIDGEVIHTPGHSDDSVSIIIDGRCAIVGDLPPLHLIPAYNDQVLEKSWNKILSKNVSEIFYAHPNSEKTAGIHSISDL